MNISVRKTTKIWVTWLVSSAALAAMVAAETPAIKIELAQGTER